MSAEDTSWVFDSLVAFLNGPIWNAPLQSFVEEKSLIFEPNAPDNEQYQAIFEEFKNLVDFMLGTFMEDIGISAQQFQEACAEGKRYPASFENNIFEQIWAANDFQMFVRMMTERNVELQLQALELIERKYGITPQSFVPKGGEAEPQPESASVIVERESKLEREILEEVAKRFAEEAPSTSAMEIEELIEQKPILQQKLKATRVTFVDETVDKAPEKPANFKPIEVDASELRKRQEYLRAQRDKLVAMKKEARQKQLSSEAASKARNRPKSAKAAEAVLNGAKGGIRASELQIRKTLAERLKAEVIEKQGN
ncbi:cilia- and flagella-associated protein 36 [Dendroctonus ponderosae]|uniref:cilia- and flagella-associated protein 36 n=1 Tax=Dendroctonus ponderosae TaxID=77166 RepID=UPI00203530C6|nr:cilia- and flagella-associated protein 36 [Dendroctonus ponderosae]KAH1000923.1 hypothetical protein HUJ04_013192 [Dendroctonus ponderosae]KAH1006501.1 hypothetical protein HUJ05_007230 [Dendroctonus ponderosae]